MGAVSAGLEERTLAEGSLAGDHAASVPAPPGERVDPGLDERRSGDRSLDDRSLDDVVSTSIDRWDRAAEDVLEPPEIDALLVRLRDLRRRIDRPVGRIAAVFADARAWRALGHARQEDYTRTRLQRTGRWLRMTAALGRAVQKFPELDRALTGRDGGRPLGKTALVKIAEVATESDVTAWISRAREVSFRQLQRDVEHARRRDIRSLKPKEGGTHERRSHVPPWELTDEEKAEIEQREGPGAVVTTLDVTVDCPAEMVVAFDEALDLHRAVSGRQASIASFVEALVAEDGAGPDGPATLTEEEESSAWRCGALRHSDDRPRRRDHPIWMDDTTPEERARRCRDEDHPAAPMLRDVTALEAEVACLEAAAEEAADRLARDAAAGGFAGEADAHELTDHLMAAGSTDAAIERAMARLLGALRRHRAWGWSGRGPQYDWPKNAPTWALGLVQYAEERLGISGSRARQLARVADRLRAYPVLREDWIGGQLATDKVLAILPLFTASDVPESLQRAWSDHARVTTLRRLDDELRELRRREPKRHKRQPPPVPLADEEWHASLLRRPGRTLGRLTKLADELVEKRPYPRTHLRLVVPFDLGTQLMAALNRAGARARREAGEGVPEDREKGRQTFSADEISRKSTPWQRRPPPPYWYGLLQLLLDYARTWDPPETPGQRPPKHAAIYEREGYRCLAPGCTGRCQLEAHHLRRVADGGTDDPANMLTLCVFHHHQGVHGLLMQAAGPAPVETCITLGRGRYALSYRADKLLRESDPASRARAGRAPRRPGPPA
jgi:hypothetical protein